MKKFSKKYTDKYNTDKYNIRSRAVCLYAGRSLLNPLPLTITNNKYEEKILTALYFFVKYYTMNTDGLISQKAMTIFKKNIRYLLKTNLVIQALNMPAAVFVKYEQKHHLRLQTSSFDEVWH